MNESTSITELVERYRHGDPQAAQRLFACYAQRLSRLAEQSLDRRLAGRIEGDDVVQSALRTFFRRSVRGEFQIDSAAQLWQLLVKITVLKARAQARRHTAGKRDVGSEQPGSPDDWLAAAADREPGPDEAAILTDEIQVLLRGLPALYTQVLELRLQGHSVTDIASRLGVARQAVYRVLDLLQQRLASRLSRPG